MNFTQHIGTSRMAAFLDKVFGDDDGWIITVVRKDYLRPITNEALMMALTHALLLPEEAHVFVGEDQRIYVAWRGEREETYKALRSLVLSALALPSSVVPHDAIVSYIDVKTAKPALRTFLTSLRTTANHATKPISLIEFCGDPLGWNVLEADLPGDDSPELPFLKVTTDQIQLYSQAKLQRIAKKSMRVLIVEDDIFYQKLLSEVLRSVKGQGIEIPDISVADSIKDAWTSVMKTAPHIVFIDLNLSDGSGHSLARAVKELDPSILAIIVTANDYEEEQDVAKQNNVDGFIVKPFNKKQIFDWLVHHPAAKAGGMVQARAIH